jgi:hypothetical protein
MDEAAMYLFVHHLRKIAGHAAQLPGSQEWSWDWLPLTQLLQWPSVQTRTYAKQVGAEGGEGMGRGIAAQSWMYRHAEGGLVSIPHNCTLVPCVFPG